VGAAPQVHEEKLKTKRDYGYPTKAGQTTFPGPKSATFGRFRSEKARQERSVKNSAGTGVRRSEAEGSQHVRKRVWLERKENRAFKRKTGGFFLRVPANQRAIPIAKENIINGKGEYVRT